VVRPDDGEHFGVDQMRRRVLGTRGEPLTEGPPRIDGPRRK
jgi:hypothetical protein